MQHDSCPSKVRPGISKAPEAVSHHLPRLTEFSAKWPVDNAVLAGWLSKLGLSVVGSLQALVRASTGTDGSP